MRWNTLSGRIFATVAALITTLLLAAGIYGEIRIRRFYVAELEARLSTAAELLARPAVATLTARGDAATFQTEIESLGRTTGLRVTVVADDGTVVADSASTPPLANHSDRPEIVDARASGLGRHERRSATTARSTHYLARRIDEDGRTLGFVRVAAELPQAELAIGELRLNLVVGGVLALALSLVVSAILARRLARPLELLEDEAARMIRDEDGVAWAAEGPDEIRRVSSALRGMARELHERMESVVRARSEIEAILSSMAEGVVAVDHEERVLLMNQAAAEMLGLTEPLQPGSALWERLRFPDLEIALREALSDHAVWHGDVASPRGDGRTLALSIAPVGTPPIEDVDAFLGAVALLSDVTQIRRLEQVRIDFVANVSHELRTPLAAVMGALETLAHPDDEETRKRFLDIASRNAARLQAIVSDLLDLSSIEAEGDRMLLEPTRVDAPLRAAAAALGGAASQKRVTLELPPLPLRPILVLGNHQRLEQVFTNLLENAIKYTPSGGRVLARIVEGERDVAVEIEDTGVGIPAASLPRVFERFYRVDRSRSREMGGTGLGLAIVKHVVKAHGGAVEVRSEEGVGSLFIVRLTRAGEPAAPGRSRIHGDSMLSFEAER
ncbi:MAG: ATP-binding protein [Planctomycetota bacterium]